jgi:hypothetical protein
MDNIHCKIDDHLLQLDPARRYGERDASTRASCVRSLVPGRCCGARSAFFMLDARAQCAFCLYVVRHIDGLVITTQMHPAICAKPALALVHD